jgi:hypothetical protein
MKPVAGNRTVVWLAVAAFVLGVAATAYRTIRQYQVPGPFDPSAQGMCDFHNGIYFPTAALLRGISPYGNEYASSYPVARQIPFFSPGILVLHAPLAVLPLRVAEVLYFAIMLAILLAIARISVAAAGVEDRLDWVAGVAALIVFSRGGHITLFNGYFTFELVLATFLAIQYAKSRPWMAAFALAVVSAKPTYILPLGFLLLARGNYRALFLGAVLSLVAAGLPLGYLAYHEGIRQTGAVDWAAGMEKIIADIGLAQEVHMSERDESPLHSWTRLDLLAGVCKWTGDEPSQLVHLAVMALMLTLPMYLLWRLRRGGGDDGLGGAAGAVIVTSVLTSLYHQSYDAMLLFAPLVAIAAGRLAVWQPLRAGHRVGLGFLLAVPLLNYFSTQTLLSRLGWGEGGFRVVTSINAFAIAAAWLALCWITWRRVRDADTGNRHPHGSAHPAAD